jgi:hypothetical protein
MRKEGFDSGSIEFNSLIREDVKKQMIFISKYPSMESAEKLCEHQH